MNTYFCHGCGTNWAPSHAIDSACPECGTGLVRSQDAMTGTAPDRHRAAMRALVERDRLVELSRQNHRDYDLHVAKRDAARMDDEEAA